MPIICIGQSWSPTNGPYGGDIKCLLFKGNQLFAGTDCGVYSTINNGDVWESKNTGMQPCTEIRSLAENNNILVAGTNNGVFISTDNGQIWNIANTGLTDLNVHCILFNGTNILIGTNIGVFKSSNNGNSWTYSSIGIPSGAYISTFIKKGTDIFAGTLGGVFKSSDNGFTWSLVNTGLPATSISVSSFAVVGATLFAVTGSGLYKTSNNGNNWTIDTSNLPTVAFGLFYNGSSLYVNSSGGIYKSVNNGNSWTAINNTITSNCFAYNNSALYIGGSVFSVKSNTSGVYMATNNESNWSSIGLGYGNGVNELYSYGSNLLCGTKNGLYMSSNQGNIWSSISKGLPINSNIESITSINNKLFAGSSTDGVYISNDNGNTWIQSNSGLTVGGKSFLNITKISNIGGVIYLGADQIILGTLAAQGCVFKSVDNGNNWIQINNGLDNYIHVMDIFASGPALYLASSLGIYLSTNNGNSWIVSNNGGPTTGVSAIKANSTNLFASQGGVFTSVDYGSSWGNNHFPQNYYVSSLLNVIEDIYAGSIGLVMKSIDNGQNWIYTGNGLPNSYVKTLAENQDSIFAGIGGRDSYSLPVGVYKYKNEIILKTNQIKSSLLNNIFPNPTSSEVKITLTQNQLGKTFKLYDNIGREKMTGVFNSTEYLLNLESFEAGIYFLKIADEDAQIKIIKN